MTFFELQKAFQPFTVFSIRDIEKAFPGFDRKILSYWQKKGAIQKIRNSWYCFTDKILDETTLFYIANKIYTPSYISLESALSYYQLIPEGVFTITSVSTKKTAAFNSPIGNFSYQSLNPRLFFGYRLIRHQNSWAKIAEPEKALLDFLYLNPQHDSQSAIAGLRLNEEELQQQVDQEKLMHYVTYIDSKALHKRLKNIMPLFYA